MELKLKQPLKLDELAQLIDAKICYKSQSDSAAAFSDLSITHLAKSIELADPCSITFLINPLYKKYLSTTKAAVILTTAEYVAECPCVALVATNPRLSLAKLLLLCATEEQSAPIGIHASAVVGENLKLGKNVSIGPNCVVGANCQFGDHVVLQAGVVVGDDCVIGDNTNIKPNVTIYHNVKIGNECSIHSGAVIGSDGFGYAPDAEGKWIKLLHLGGVEIGNQVEIGSNTSIDRGMLDNTVIGNNVIIDNLVQIAHNVTIGDKTAIAGCVGIAGSTSIGKNCMIGGAANIAGHISIADRVVITGTSAVNNSLTEPGVYSSGIPARENSVWRRNVARFMLLDNMAKKIKDLEQAVAAYSQN